MSLNCPDLCTADKCRELEARIEQLELQLSTLYQEFIAHTQFTVVNAHEFDVAITGQTRYDHTSGGIGMDIWLVRTNDSTLLSTGRIESQSVPYVLEWDFNAHKQEEIPEAHPYKPELLLDVFEQNDGTYVIKLQVDGNPVEETFFFDQLAIAATKINSTQTSLEVSLGNRRSSTTLTLENFQTETEDSILDFNILDLSNSNDYEFTVSLGRQSVTRTLNLPYSGGGGGSTIEPPEISVGLEGSYNAETAEITLRVTVNGKSAETIITLDSMDDIRAILQLIFEAVNTEVKGNYQIGKTDVSLLDENGNKQIDYSLYKPIAEGEEGFIDTNYIGNGFTGVNQAFVALDKKITNLHQDLARAIDPLLSIETINPADCYEGITRDDYTVEEWEALPLEVKAHIEKDFGDRFREFINNNLVLSEFAEPLLSSVESLAFKIPSIPAFFAVNFTSNVLLHQFREDTAPISCKYVPKEANLDTVVITASEKDIHRVKDKLLVLHLVTLDNYPDRQRGAGLWVVQIPAPLAEYVWEEHFDSLRWQRGNLYAQMNLEGYKTTVSGWFESENAANNWFDAVLGLTTATEKNRIISLHKTPKTNITVQTTRPYRAFITDTDGNGNAVCLTKYKPIIINE
ncbi:MAG: hypothetical protein AB4368_22125 [Xenococcaceae cyanobacterium]